MAAAASGAAFEGSKASGQYRASEAFAESKPLEAPQTSRTSVAFGASEASATPSTAASLPPIRPSDMSEVVEASAAASKPDPRSFRGASDASESSRAFAGVSDGASSSFFGAGASEPPRASEKPRDVSLHGKICCCASSRRSGDAASEGDGLRREKQAHCNCGKVGQEAATCRSHLQPVSSGPSSGKHGGPEREGRAQGDVSDEVDRFGRFRTGSTVAFASGDSGNGLSCREGSRESRGESVADLIRQYEPDVRKILDAGVRYVVLTLGARGVCVSRFATQEEGYTSGGDGIERSGRLLATSSGTGDSSTLFSQPRRFPSHLMPLSIQPQAPAQRAVDAPSSSLRGIVHHHVPALPARVVGLTGAGDSVVAGTVAGLVTGQAANPVEAAAFGVAAARLTVQSARNVPEGLSVEAIRGTQQCAVRPGCPLTLWYAHHLKNSLPVLATCALGRSFAWGNFFTMTF